MRISVKKIIILIGVLLFVVAFLSLNFQKDAIQIKGTVSPRGDDPYWSKITITPRKSWENVVVRAYQFQEGTWQEIKKINLPTDKGEIQIHTHTSVPGIEIHVRDLETPMVYHFEKDIVETMVSTIDTTRKIEPNTEYRIFYMSEVASSASSDVMRDTFAWKTDLKHAYAISLEIVV